MPWLNGWSDNRGASSLTNVCTRLSWLLLYGLCLGDSSQTAAGAQLGARACSSAPTDLRIPRLIHRNYMEGRSAMYAATQVDNPSWQLHWLLSCKAHHPTWAEMVWSEPDILGLIIEEYPWFLSTYQTYSKHVFRSDLARFVILHKHGGVYLDADVECYKDMEPSLAGLDLVINCRTYDVAHNAAMASVAGHPVWIQAMKAAMAVVQRLSPVVSADPLTATGPVLMSQAVQEYYGISKEHFCDRLHVKDGLILKAYPKGQWFTPCWPWANLLCYKKLETERKFLVRSDPKLEHVVGVHHYSGTWFGQASNSKDKLRQRNRMLAAAATVSFFWESPHFVEYTCNSTTAVEVGVAPSSIALGGSNSASIAGSSTYTSSSSSSSLNQRLVHKRPGLISSAKVNDATSTVVRRMLETNQPATSAATGPAAAAAAAAAGGTAGPQAVEVLPVKQEAGTPLAGSSLFACPAVQQLASLQPCLVLSVVQPTPSKQLAAVGTTQTLDTSGSSSTTSSSNSSSAYWADVESMLSMWQQSLSCHVTVATLPDASSPSKLMQLAAGSNAAAQSTESNGVDSTMQLQPLWSKEQGFMMQQEQQGGAATFVNVSASAAATEKQGSDAALLLAQLLQQQQEQQLHALGCDKTSGSNTLPPRLTCKAPARQTALHLSCSADFLVELAEHIYSYNAQVGHEAFEQHARYAGAIHTMASAHGRPATSCSSAKLRPTVGNGQSTASAQQIIAILDAVDILLADVERPRGPATHRQGWSTLYNLLYQLHGFVGFYRKVLPDGRTRLGWIRRPERLDKLACTPTLL